MPLSEAFQAWERLVRKGHPWTDPLHPWQDARENLDARADLEFALHALPRRAARELRSLVNPLDGTRGGGQDRAIDDLRAGQRNLTCSRQNPSNTTPSIMTLCQ
jgi:hypothetical protein